MKYKQVIDGVPYDIIRFKDRVMCCDCGLVHDVDYKIVGSKISVTYRVNNRATAAARRKR